MWDSQQIDVALKYLRVQGARDMERFMREVCDSQTCRDPKSMLMLISLMQALPLFKVE
jgi:hypothetical protein